MPATFKSNQDPALIPIKPGAITLNDINVNSGIIMRERKLLNNQNLWHKIIVHNVGTLSRDYILKTIMIDVHPEDFIPICFYTEASTVCFFIRNARMAIEKLCRQNLIVPNPTNKNKPFKLTIILAFTSTADLAVNVQDNIDSVLTKRYTLMNKMLNLDNFCKDPDLLQYCPLSQPKIFYFVLHLSKHYQIHSLKLSNNDIHILSPMESVWGLKSLTTLDLRNNMIENMSELNILKTLHIKELFMDGNPVCDKFDEYSYIQAAREVCPKLQKLDGVILGQIGFLPFRRNYLCNPEAEVLIDAFLEHFFTLFDADRSSLSELYTKDALFSVTCSHITGHASSSSAGLRPYKRLSRNLKMLSDLSKNSENLWVGNKKIMQAFEFLPRTEHDPYSFTVDLLFHSFQISIVIITGSFREPAESLLEAETIFGFSRTFVIRAAENNEYNIINDMWYVSNASTSQQQRAFKIVRVPRYAKFKIEPAKTSDEKKEMLDAFNKITTLKSEYGIKFLEECKYDLAKALLMFVDLYKTDQIHEGAFA